jgi:hypothetical protein
VITLLLLNQGFMFAYMKTISHCPANDPYCKVFERIYDQDEQPFQNTYLMIFEYFSNYQMDTNTQMFVFICWTFTVPFVMMNLLIAFVSNTFNQVNEKKETASYREIAGLILDLELLSWAQKDKNEHKFLSFASENENRDGDHQIR